MFFQQLVNGLMLGSSYALIAVGYSLIFGVMGLLHFAHGEVFMVGAFIALQMVLFLHVSLPVAMLGAMTATAILGIIIAAIGFLPIKKEYVAAPLIATIGLGIIMQNLAVKIFGGDPVSFPETIALVNYKIGDVIINSLQILMLCVTLALMILLSVYIKNTKMGKAMRASAERPITASLLGVNYQESRSGHLYDSFGPGGCCWRSHRFSLRYHIPFYVWPRYTKRTCRYAHGWPWESCGGCSLRDHLRYSRDFQCGLSFGFVPR